MDVNDSGCQKLLAGEGTCDNGAVNARVVSVQIGRVCDEPIADGTFRTALRKRAVTGPVRAHQLGLAGDAQEHRDLHGGPDRAILAYAAHHYEAWRGEHPEHDFPYGSFGDNLVLAGLDETSVCIGDRHAIGEVLLEVSVPRTPCGALSMVHGMADLYAEVKRSGRTGWLYRVLEEGLLAAGDAVVLVDRPHPEWTITRAALIKSRIRKLDPDAVDAGRQLASCPALAAEWRTRIAEDLAKQGLGQ